jgi:hypothetical protein
MPTNTIWGRKPQIREDHQEENEEIKVPAT